MADYRRAICVLLILLVLIGVAGCCAPWTEPPFETAYPPSAHRSNEAGDGAVTPAAAATPPRRNKDSPAELFV
jgi:hypothetical protein